MLKDLGEREAINRLMAKHSKQQPKDDCSIIKGDKESFMISTDSITPASHLPKGSNSAQIGEFFANITLSDIAAMAGVPQGFLSAYTLPAETEIEFLEGVETGVNKVLNKYDLEHLGGDLKEGKSFTMTGIALGKQKNELIRRRADIKEGQIIGVTNSIGKAASGYIFFKSGYRKSYGIDLMLGISARIREAQAISKNGGKFMMDLSDGIFSSVSQVKNDYGIGFKLVEDSVPPDKNVEKAQELSGASLRDILFSYGGDYELLFTLDNDDYGEFLSAMESEGIEVTIIGQAWDGDNMIFDGEKWEVITQRGYEHFLAKPPLGRIK